MVRDDVVHGETSVQGWVIWVNDAVLSQHVPAHFFEWR